MRCGANSSLSFSFSNPFPNLDDIGLFAYKSNTEIPQGTISGPIVFSKAVNDVPEVGPDICLLCLSKTKY